MTNEEFKKLAEKVASGTASEDELLLYNRICNFIENSAQSSEDVLNKAELGASMKTAIDKKTAYKSYRIGWLRWAAAAVFVVLAGVAYNYFQPRPAPNVEQSASKPTPRFKNDVAPGRQGAVLTLANGQTIVLDSASNGAIATQGNTELIKKDGQLLYQANGSTNELIYNTVSTPRGRQFHLTLSDGTDVWLNAGSSISYPTVFVGKERRVKITGEVYFEVAHNRGMPFEVEKEEVTIRVLGTRFNVNAYEEESALKVTLLEGSVKVGSGKSENIIRPGQQAQVSSGSIAINNRVDIIEVMAWKNGNFHFAGSDIRHLMRQISRWYAVDVVYNKKVDDLFYAEIPINTQLSDVLKALELTGKVRFAIDGNKIIVMP